MHQRIMEIAQLIGNLADPIKTMEDMLALHTKQLNELLDPTPPPPPPPGDILFDACFNTGNCGGSKWPLGFYWHHNPPVVVASGDHGVDSCEGTHLIRTYLHRTKSKHSYRTMGLYCAEDDMAPDTRQRWMYDFGKHYWMTISMFLPDDWVMDPLSNVLWQCQATPDAGETYRQPCLYIGIKGNQWHVKSRWDTRKLSPAEEGTRWPHSEMHYEASISPDLGKWTDWMFHVVWSWEGDGLVEAWKNGVQIADRSGPNCSNDARGPNSSFGIYEFSWREEYWSKFTYKAVERDVWFDSIRVGRQRADVAIST